jgi:hypothetical protein
MRVGVRDQIELRIAKNLPDDFQKALMGSGRPKLHAVKVSSAMQADLSGDDFDIKLLGGEQTRAVAPEGFTPWVWNVTPLAAGNNRQLYLDVAARITTPEGVEPLFVPVFRYTIHVQANYPYSVKKLLKDNQATIGKAVAGSGVLGVVGGWFVRKKNKNKNKKTQKQSPRRKKAA